MNKLILSFVIIISSNSYCQNPILGDQYQGIAINFNDSIDSEHLLINPDTNDLWQIDIPNKQYFTGSRSIFTDTNQFYGSNTHSWFQVKVSDFYYGYPFLIEFEHRLHTVSGIDGGFIEVSYDNGQTFSNVQNDSIQLNEEWYFNESMSDNFYSDLDTLFNGEPGFSGLVDTFEHVRIVYNYYCVLQPNDINHTFEIDTAIFRFNFISDSIQTNHGGWQIDNLFVSVDQCIGIEDIHSNAFQLIQNPVEEYIYLNEVGYNHTNYDLEIYDVNGRLVYSKEHIENGSSKTDVSFFISGSYFLIIRNDEHEIISRHKVLKL